MLMLFCMRTTLDIDDRLGRRARRRAADTGMTLTAVIEQALRESFAREDAGHAERVPLPVSDGDGVAPGIDLSNNRELRDVMDGLA